MNSMDVPATQARDNVSLEPADNVPCPFCQNQRSVRRSFWRQLIKRACLALAVIALVAGGSVYEMARRQKLEVETSKKRIPRTEIDLIELTLQPQSFGNGDWYTVAGRVRNRSSQHTLVGLGLLVTMRDRLPSGDADVIGEERVRIWDVDIPPNQTREIKNDIRFDHLPKALGRNEWSYAVTEIRGK